jgi:hypothetical protein
MFTAILNSTAQYESHDPENQSDINKLYGFREGVSTNNSARIGWNFKDGKLWLYPYVHSAGINYGSQDPKPLCSVEFGEQFKCSIRATAGSYFFTVDTKEGNYAATGPRDKRWWHWPRFLQFPYFGGDEVAPHDITVCIRKGF